MYKVAILFYGHLRSFKSTFPYFKENVLEANRDCEVDVFIHTWDELEHPAPRRQYKKDLEVAGKKIQKEDIDFINEHYRPMGLKITPQIYFTEEQKQQIAQNGFKEENYYAILNVSYSMEQVHTLKEQAKKDYDFVILTRFDIIFYQKLNLSCALDMREQGIKYTQFTPEDFNASIFYAYMERDLYPELLRNQRNYITGIDLFCAGSNSAMDRILKWHDEILSLPPMGIEYWLTKKVVDNGLIPQIIYYDKPRCFHILRTNDIGFKLAGGGAFLMKERIRLQKLLWNWKGVKNLYELSLLNDKILIFEYLSFCLETGQINVAFSLLERFGEITLKNLLYKDSSLKSFGESFFGFHKQFQLATLELDMQNLGNHLIFLSHHQCIAPLKKILKEQNVFLKIPPQDVFRFINFAINALIAKNSLEADLALKLLEDFSKIPLDNTLAKQYFLSSVVEYFYHQANKEFFSKRPLLSLGSLVHLVSDGEVGSRLLTQKIYEIQKAFYPLNQIHEKPKIAILIAGQVRGEYKALFQKLKEEVIEPLEADCFLVSWTTRLKEQPIALSNSGWIHCLKSDVRRLAPKEFRETSNRFLKENFPLTYEKLSFAQKVNFQIEAQDIQTLHLINYALEDEEKWQKGMNVSGNALKMRRIFYSMYRAFGLMSKYEAEQNFTYDYVVKIRPDILYSRIAILKEKLHLLQHNEVFVDFFEYGIQDQFFVGRREAIAKVVEIYKRFGTEDKDCFSRLFPQDIPLAHSSHHFLYWWYANNNLYARRSPVGRIFNANQEVAKAKLPDVYGELVEDFKNLKEPYKYRRDFYEFFERVFEVKLPIPLQAKYSQPSNVASQKIKSPAFSCVYSHLATHRIHSHLAYKLGQAMILNSKSLWGYIRMPYVLSYIKAQHRFEQEKYQKAIAKNPSLKLPKLESYPDYKEALREKECFTYKLGEALMQAGKDWYKGGFLRFFLQDVPRLKREFEGKRK